MAEQALMAATGEMPLCRVGEGPDHQVEHVKHAEGCVAAIAEVQRQLRSTGEDPVTAVAAVLAAWPAGEDAARGRNGVWLVYRRGGVEALKALSGDMAAMGPGRGSAAL